MSFIAIVDAKHTKHKGSAVSAQATAQVAAGWLAQRAWARRREMLPDLPSPAEALALAAARYVGPKAIATGACTINRPLITMYD